MPSPEYESLVEQLRTVMPPEGAEIDLAERRAMIEAIFAAVPIEASCHPIDAGGVPCEWIVGPEASHARTLLYLHGGGYIIGSIASHRALVARLSEACDARALAVDYRLAPEAPHPAAVEDAVAVYRWLLDQGTEPKSIVIAGDSAGGGLTVATLVALRDAGIALPAAGVCISPWVDMECRGDSMTSRADRDPMLRSHHLLEMAKMYLGDQDPRSPLASPIHADLRGLPPLLIQVGGCETLYDDATRLAERARAAGVEVTFDEWDEMFHVWHAFAHQLPEGQQAIDRIGDYVKQRIF